MPTIEHEKLDESNLIVYDSKRRLIPAIMVRPQPQAEIDATIDPTKCLRTPLQKEVEAQTTKDQVDGTNQASKMIVQCRGSCCKQFMDKVEEDHATQFLQVVGNTADLASIDTNGYSIARNVCEALAEKLRHQPKLEAIYMNDSFTRRRTPEIHPSLTALSSALLNHQFITVLDFGHNALNQYGAKALCPLISNCLTLKELHLVNTGIYKEGGESIAKALLDAHALAKKRGLKYQLERFLCGRSRLETSIPALARSFAHLGTLREIQVAQNGVTADGTCALLKAMKLNPNLEVLNVSDCVVNLVGSKVLAQMIPCCPKLKQLACSDCKIGVRGGKVIADALPNAMELQVLDLSNNEMGDPSLDLFIKALANKNLRAVDLMNGNNLTVGGREKMMKNVKRLVELSDDYEEDDAIMANGKPEDPDEADSVGFDAQAEWIGEWPFVDTPEAEHFGLAAAGNPAKSTASFGAPPTASNALPFGMKPPATGTASPFGINSPTSLSPIGMTPPATGTAAPFGMKPTASSFGTSSFGTKPPATGTASPFGFGNKPSVGADTKKVDGKEDAPKPLFSGLSLTGGGTSGAAPPWPAFGK